FFQKLAEQVNDHIKNNMEQWKLDYPGVEKMKVAVMGCVVNGPGESSHADIAISLPGKNEEKMAPVFADGRLIKTILGDDIPQQFIKILETYVKEKYKNL
ncbi:flavodoxin-dependent (E)-4-hydroxy-3-methylbut-2-enyl-diphosphate synthase, partial [Patescibacteria group bacterium]